VCFTEFSFEKRCIHKMRRLAPYTPRDTCYKPPPCLWLPTG
jgi:hypothetical protein